MAGNSEGIMKCSAAGKIWHPRAKTCMTLDEFQNFEKFYGRNSEAAKKHRTKHQQVPSPSVDVPNPDAAIQAEVRKRKAQ